MFEAVGDVPRAVEAVGAEGPVGAQEADRQEAGDDAEREGPVGAQEADRQEAGEDAERGSPAPTPEPEPEEEQVPEGAGRFVTRSGRQWGLISNATTTMRRNLTIISVDLARTSTIHRTLESHSGLATPLLTRSLPLHPKQWGV